MKIQYHGISAVDIAGHDGVEPGDVVDVPAELGEALLANGQWSAAKKTTTTESAAAEKES